MVVAAVAGSAIAELDVEAHVKAAAAHLSCPYQEPASARETGPGLTEYNRSSWQLDSQQQLPQL
jgi:hypothetical protein